MPAIIYHRIEQHAGVAFRRKPAVLAHLSVQLPRSPSGVTQSDQPLRGAPAMGNVGQISRVAVTDQCGLGMIVPELA
jgi:hypothetical protein